MDVVFGVITKLLAILGVVVGLFCVVFAGIWYFDWKNQNRLREFGGRTFALALSGIVGITLAIMTWFDIPGWVIAVDLALMALTYTSGARRILLHFNNQK